VIEIQCPRCKQYWYSDEDEGRVRLCSQCADDLRRKHGPRAEIDIPFLIGVGMCLVFDLMLIALTALLPAVFGKVMLVIGFVLFFAGLIFLRILSRETASLWFWGFDREVDWTLGRWALLSILTGLACILAYGSFVGFAK
jgi:hypothetical protein